MSQSTASVEVLNGDLKSPILDDLIQHAAKEAFRLLRYRLVCKSWSKFVNESEPWQMLVVDHTERMMYKNWIIERRQFRRQRNLERQRWGVLTPMSALAIDYDHN